MAKKKLSLKPVQRGFATTSTASKKADQPLDVITTTTTESSSNDPPVSTPGNDQPQNVHSEPTNADWEQEKSAEQLELQALVDRLHERAEREVLRIIKAIEFDKRLAASFPKLDINQDIRDRVLQLALEDGSPEATTFLPSGSLSDSDKSISRVYIAHQVLGKLGFSESRIDQCLQEALGDGGGWEEALDWMWLHLSEDECLSRGDFATAIEPTLPDPDPPLLDVPIDVPVVAPDPLSARPHSPKPAAPSIAFQAQDDSSDSSDPSDDEPDLNRINEKWATLMLEMHTLNIAAGAGKKAKKGKSAVVLETPQIRNVKSKLTAVEKEYMFNRKEADVIFKSLKTQHDATALERRLKGGQPETSEDTPADTSVPLPDLDSGEESLFGALLDDPPEQAPETNTTVDIISMPIPKQFAFGGNLPKVLLRTLLAKSAKQAVITYARLSGGSRAVRVGLEIRWSAERRRVWRMEQVACEDQAQAENYVSTLALSELAASGETSINWRSMPVAYKDLWEELEQARQVKDDEQRRIVWAKMQSIVLQKTAPKPTAEGLVKSAPPPTIAAEPTERSLIDPSLQQTFAARSASPAYRRMRTFRDQLPIASFRDQIIATLESSQVIVLSGETGCGKSTQLPSFILEDQLKDGKPCKIFVTEPRRISAISLAQRVSQELGDNPGAMGSTSSLVGYSIRLESKISSTTRLAFVTNGIALRMLEGGSGRGTAFDEVTHIIVDEVHERSIESDFLLIVLKSLLQQRKDLKVVLMSATLDAEKISAFFGGCPYLAVPGRTFPVQVNYLEDAVETAGWHIDESSHYAIRSRNAKGGAKLEWTEETAQDDSDTDDDPTRLASTRYTEKTVSTVNLLDSRQIPYDLIIRLLETICFESHNLQQYSAATLVFMPGLAEIRKLNDMLCGHPAFGSTEFVIYPLHSTISSEGQSAVFNIPPRGARKIVISTNIAETGVTIPDITCVIDSGKHREMRYDEKRQLSRLVETYIAQSNAKQRRGRAGRVQEGLAYHLFTKARHDTKLAEHPVPEMLRLSLQDLALRIKILKVKLGNTVEDVLSRALDPPSSLNIQRALSALVEVKALTLAEEITPMGRLLSKLPMDVHLGKFLLVAALYKCLDPALTIAATLNSKSPFVTPFGFEHAANVAKRSFAVGNSDFLTIVNVFDSWRRASDNPTFVRTFCRRNFVSQQNLQQIEDLRQQLLAYLIDSSFVSVTSEQRSNVSQARFSRGVRTRFVIVPQELNVNGNNAHVIGGALAAGLYPKLLSLESGVLKTVTNQQPVAIHPSSSNFKTPKSDFGTNYLTYFTLMQSKKLYAWETGPVDDRALALLCGDQVDVKLAASLFQIDRKIRWQIEPKTALAIKLLREQFAVAMSMRLRGRVSSESQKKWFELGLECLMTGLWDSDGPPVGVV